MLGKLVEGDLAIVELSEVVPKYSLIGCVRMLPTQAERGLFFMIPDCLDLLFLLDVAAVLLISLLSSCFLGRFREFLFTAHG